MPLPILHALDRPDASGLPLASRLWGAEERAGTLNNITPDSVAVSAPLIQRGRRFAWPNRGTAECHGNSLS